MLPSVTTVLSRYQDLSKIPEHILYLASIRGRVVHDYAKNYALGLYIPRPGGTATGYCESFERWFDEYVVEVLFVEEEITSKIYGYLGHPDICAKLRFKDGPGLYDYKTPIALQPVWKSQIAAYRNATKEDRGISTIEGGTLRLDPKGRMARLDPYHDSARDFANFLNALFAFKAFCM